MPLVLTPRFTEKLPIDATGLTPGKLADKGVGEIEQLPLLQGNREVPLGDLFKVAGNASDGVLRFEGDLSSVHQIGAGLDAGEIQVAGPAGRHAGSGMRGGTLTIAGDAGDWLGAEMRGGRIRVGGNTGHCAGAAYRGSRKGMTGGELLIAGSAGDEVGAALRRGLIAVGGATGACCGYRLIAGTILCFGAVGLRPGAEMRRGTLGLLGTSVPALLPTFRFDCRYRPQFLRLYLRRLRSLSYAPAVAADIVDVARYSGDLLAGGKGELLTAV